MARKSINGKIYNQSDKTYYDAVDVSAALTGKKLFQTGDQANGALTNFKGSGGKLPTGYKMNILKIGFIYRLSTGAALTPATLSKLVTGTYNVKLGEDELKEGSMAEFFDSALTVATSTNAPMLTKAFIPLLGDEGEWWDDNQLDFSISTPAMEASGQLMGCVKGLLYVPKA